MRWLDDGRCRRAALLVLTLSVFWSGARAGAQDFDRMYNDQDVATNHINRGLAKLQAENLYGARKEFEFVVAMEKNTGKKHVAHLNLGVVHVLENNWEPAIRNFLAAIKLNPAYAEAYFNLGGVYYKQKALKKAEEAFLKAVEIQPDYGRAHYSLGFVYLDQKKYERARRHADRAAEHGVPFKTLQEKLAQAGR